MENQKNLFWLTSVNMGYGHQRTAYPLSQFAVKQKSININDYEGIPRKDKRVLEITRRFYEFMSNIYQVPFVGRIFFSFLDILQKIFSFYPKRDLSRPSFQLKQIMATIKNGLSKDIVEKFKNENKKLKINPPFVATFFMPAFGAEFFSYPGEIFCVVCDADISRAWAPLNPKNSKIKYFAPTTRVAERLKLYGVKSDNIFLAGYPLPLDNIGTNGEKEILKEDLRNRILNLDPTRKYIQKYSPLIENKLGKLPEKSNHTLTLMFSVGGAGAQKEIATKIVKSLSAEITQGKIKIILSAGVKEKIRNYFVKNIEKMGLSDSGIEILYEKNINDYFRKFNLRLRTTDILWTKPSELSFYSALGVPILMAPTIGSQEEFNKRWLLKSGFGIAQENPLYANQWLFDWLNQGYFAEAAMQGFVEGKQLGVLNILKIIKQTS